MIKQERTVLKKMWDNEQKIIEKKCKKCGNIFTDKLLNGYQNCKECNSK